MSPTLTAILIFALVATLVILVYMMFRHEGIVLDHEEKLREMHRIILREGLVKDEDAKRNVGRKPRVNLDKEF